MYTKLIRALILCTMSSPTFCIAQNPPQDAAR
jgi:hypothetical protein